MWYIYIYGWLSLRLIIRILQTIQDLMFPPIPPNVDLVVGPALFPPRASASANLLQAIRQVIHRQHRQHGMVPFRDLSVGWFPLFFNQIPQPWFRSSKGHISTIIVIVVWDTTCRHAEITCNDRRSGRRPSIHLKGYMPHMCRTQSGFIGLILHLEVVTANPIWPWKHIPCHAQHGAFPLTHAFNKIPKDLGENWDQNFHCQEDWINYIHVSPLKMMVINQFCWLYIPYLGRYPSLLHIFQPQHISTSMPLCCLVDRNTT